MSLTNKTISSTYKDVISIDNSNAGFDTNIDQIRSGNGNGSALYLSTNNFKVQPTADSTTNSVIYDKDGNILFQVDSTNDAVKALGNHVNTQYAYFGINSTDSSSFIADKHFAIPYNSLAAQSYISTGTGTDPSSSLTSTSAGDEIACAIWYVPDEIVIDAVYVWVGADTSTGDTIRFHLMSYDIDSSNSSTGGDLSNGTVLADGADITNAGYEQTYYQSMTIQSSSVTAGKVVIFTFRQDSVNSDYSINTTVKYHLI